MTRASWPCRCQSPCRGRLIRGYMQVFSIPDVSPFVDVIRRCGTIDFSHCTFRTQRKSPCQTSFRIPCPACSRLAVDSLLLPCCTLRASAIPVDSQTQLSGVYSSLLYHDLRRPCKVNQRQMCSGAGRSDAKPAETAAYGRYRSSCCAWHSQHPVHVNALHSTPYYCLHRAGHDACVMRCTARCLCLSEEALQAPMCRHAHACTNILSFSPNFACRHGCWCECLSTSCAAVSMLRW